MPSHENIKLYSKPQLQLGESLNGYIARCLARSGVRNRGAALSAFGLKRHDLDLEQSLGDEKSLLRLANFLSLEPHDIRQMAYSSLRRYRTYSRPLRHFHGNWIASDRINVRGRRLSPTALRGASFHRAAWMLTPFELDGETLEPLIDTCPVCNRSLGWDRSVLPHYCDKCIDGNGMPCTDLRDFVQPVAKMDDGDAEAYRYMWQLIDPASADHRPKSMDDNWKEFRPSTMFELGCELVELLVGKKPYSRKKGFPINSSMLACAARYVMAGRKGIELAEEELQSLCGRPVLWRGIVLNTFVSESLRQLVASIVPPDNGDGDEQQETYSAWSTSRMTGLSCKTLMKNVGQHQDTTRTSEEITYYKFHPVRSLAEELNDTADIDRVATILGLLPKEISLLINLGLMSHPQGDVEKLIGYQPMKYVKGSEAVQLLNAVHDHAAGYEANLRSFREICKSGSDVISLGLILAALQRGTVKIGRVHSKSGCWADSFGTSSTELLYKECRDIVRRNGKLFRSFPHSGS